MRVAGKINTKPVNLLEIYQCINNVFINALEMLIC